MARKYDDKITLTNTQSMDPVGRDQFNARNQAKSLAEQREQTMLRYFGNDIYDPYFDLSSRSAMAKTPWGRERLHEEGVASGRIKSATQQAEEGWLKNSPLSPAATYGKEINPALLNPNDYRKKWSQDDYPSTYSVNPDGRTVSFHQIPQGNVQQRQAPVRPGF